MKRICLLFFLPFSIILSTNAQDSTFESVVKIFDRSCNSESCHATNGTHPLKLQGTLDEIYTNLINTDPINPAALKRGNKLIKPGDPKESFLYRKINNGLYAHDKISEQEGQNMPPAESLTDVEKETIRQWILWAAPKEGLVHNETILNEYYIDKNRLDRVEELLPPAEGAGFQYNLGTLFLEPNEEIEVFQPIKLPIGDSLEITGFDVKMNDFSHHYAVARAVNGFENNISPGFTVVDNFITSFDFFNNSEFITGSQLSEKNYKLPNDIAFRWDDESSNTLTFNYHIKNYSSTGILPAEVYLNIYVQPKYTATKVMIAETVTYSIDNVFALEIFPNAKDTTFVMEHYIENSDEVIDIWQLLPHTHALGVDYDVFLRNADGSKGEQVYEGYYNYEQDFNQGFFDYSHATPLVFKDEPLRVKMSEGLILEATYNNDREDTVTFGLTTDDEMFIGYYLYTKSEIVSVPNFIDDNNIIDMRAFPNPFKNKLFLDTEKINGNAIISIYDINGKLVFSKALNTNIVVEEINLQSLVGGTYFVQISDGNNILKTKKVIKQ